MSEAIEHHQFSNIITIAGRYQAHLKVLQAGQYGSPQSRLRVIFWGSKRTLPLPPFPIPTHCTPDDVDKYKLPTGRRLWPVVRVIPDSEHREEWLQFAPLLPVTIEDAISGLVCFSFVKMGKKSSSYFYLPYSLHLIGKL